MPANVTCIPATKNRFTALPVTSIAKRKVAAYARVSTDSDEQFTSYTAQIDYYTDYIQQHADWEFVRVYTDEGISGLNTRHRDGFNEMIADALDGKIDLIVTKSVSRFARNTVDSLVTIRKLKEHGVECYFEKEAIFTFDGKGELLLTIMSSLAQEESRSISENVTWGMRKRFSDGKVSMAYSQFLGYEKGADGKPAVNENEAETVRLIYRLFLEGKTPFGIRDALEAAGIRSPKGKGKWSVTTINSILRNEKYKGDALLQKSFTVDFLTKTMKPNRGELPSYYVKESHPAIIPADEFDMVQAEIERRSHQGRGYSGNGLFSSKLFCADCGGIYGAKVWHSNDKYRRVVWQCDRKFTKDKELCKTPHLTEDAIKGRFLRAYNELMSDREQLLADCEMMKSLLSDRASQEESLAQTHQDIEEVAELIQNLVKQNARQAQAQDEYNSKYDALVARYEKAVDKYGKLETEIATRRNKAQQIIRFIDQLRSAPLVLTEWDNQVWSLMVEKGTVSRDRSILFEFRNGKAIKVEAK
ncbi:MAG: recombinase family protein [Eubacteriales bacterium]|nr:recombinase family protein [Eubacteriales bacterium]MDD4513425.1 recombinase family protein [Eubacteriales bacterium]